MNNRWLKRFEKMGKMGILTLFSQKIEYFGKNFSHNGVF